MRVRGERQNREVKRKDITERVRETRNRMIKKKAKRKTE